MRYTNYKLEQSILRCNKNNKSVQITYEKLKDELREKYLDKSKTPSEVSIVSGELNIFIYQKETSAIRKLIESCDSSTKLDLYMHTEILVDEALLNPYANHPMVNAINSGIDKTIYITDSRVPVQLILVDDILYLYGTHARYELNYLALDKEHLANYGNLRDKIEVIKIELDKCAREELEKYFIFLKDMTKPEHIIRDSFEINPEKTIMKPILTTVEKMRDELIGSYADSLYFGTKNDNLTINDCKKFFEFQDLNEEVLKEVYNNYMKKLANAS